MTPTPHPLAVVTGASAGIGLELARGLARRGHDLVVASEDPAIDGIPALLDTPDVDIDVVEADLSRSEGVELLATHLAGLGRAVDVLALNAGRGAGGAFVSDTDLDDELEVIDLNVRSTVHLAKRLVPAMVEADRGRILFTSSIAATMPGSYQAVYNASKAFVQSFALALAEELDDRDSAVTVTSLMPGPTDTEFFARADMRDTKVANGPMDTPEEVADDGLEALFAGRTQVVAGSLRNTLQAKVGGRLLPDSAKAKLHAAQARPGSADTDEEA